MKAVDIVIATPAMLSPHDPTDYPNIKVVAVAGEHCPMGECRLFYSLETLFTMHLQVLLMHGQRMLTSIIVAELLRFVSRLILKHGIDLFLVDCNRQHYASSLPWRDVGNWDTNSE